MRYEREGAWQSNALKIRVDGTEKTRKHEWMYFLHFGACVYWWVGCCTSQSIAIAIPQVPGGFKIVYFDNKKTHNSTTYSSTARIIGRTEWWNSTRTTCPASYRITERTEWRHFNKAWRVSVTGGGDYYYYYMYRIDYINYLSTTSINLKCPTTLTTILYHVPGYLATTMEYQVPGIKKEKRQGKKEKKRKKNEKWNKNKRTCSGSRPSPDGTRLLFADGTVSPMMCPSDGQQKHDEKGQTEDKPRWGRTQSRKKQEKTATRWWVFLEFVFICLVFRGDPVWHRIAIYIVVSYPISCDITRYDISRC